MVRESDQPIYSPLLGASREKRPKLRRLILNVQCDSQQSTAREKETLQHRLQDMDFADMIGKNRSIRTYRPNPVPDKVLSQILEAARLARRRGHRQPCHFIVVKDLTTKRKLEIPDSRRTRISSWSLVQILTCPADGTLLVYRSLLNTLFLRPAISIQETSGLASCGLTNM